MPFENELVVLYLPGASITKLAQFIVQKGGQPVSNLLLEAKGDSITTLLINNQPIEPTKTYRVLTSDYLANGGDGILAFKDAIKKENTNIKVRDAIIEYMRNEQSAGRTLNPMLDGRIKIEK
jgi:2',3'-cyclic-nucleotide 2'-phosphodiesterase (5'-nucleotidase family)